MLKNEKFKVLGNSLSLQSLSLPGVASELSGFSETACAATVVANVIWTSAAASTHDVHGFSRAFTHWWSAFSHCSSHRGGGEIRTTLSPRTMISPSFFWFSTSVVSSVSSKTRLRCWSKPFSLPLRLFPPFNRTRTILLRFCSRISVVISLILESSILLFYTLDLNI